MGAAACARESEWETFRRLITHDDRNSYYVVSSCANGTWEDVAVRKGNLAVLGFSDAASYYMTHNGFFEPNRKSGSARQLNALFFDLDCHDRPITQTRAVVERTIAALRQACDAGSLPTPTMVIDSGRGVQLFYVLRRSVPTYSNGKANSKSITFFECVQRRMMDVLEHLLSPIDGISVDRATGDLSRVSRIPGTYNHSAKRVAHIVEASEVLHSLSELSSFASEYLIKNVTASSPRPARKAHATMLHYEPLMMSRLSKVIELQAYRHFQCAGQRELMCFVFYNTAVQIYQREDARNRLRSFNARFVEPLDASELSGIERSIDNVTNHLGQAGFYLIGAQRLTELLGLTEEENSAIRFFESKRVILRAQAKRDTRRKREARNKRIVELRKTTNLTQRQIAQETGVSLRTVASVLKQNAANERKRRLQGLTKQQGEQLRERLQSKSNKNQKVSCNNKQSETCNFLSYVSLKFRPSLLSEPSRAVASWLSSLIFNSVSFSFGHKEASVTESGEAGTFVTEALSALAFSFTVQVPARSPLRAP